MSENYSDLMQRYGQQISKIAQKWDFPPFVTPPRSNFFSTIGHPFIPLRFPNFMKKNWKNQWTVFEMFKDRPLTDGHGWLHRTPSDKPGSTDITPCKCLLIVNQDSSSDKSFNLHEGLYLKSVVSHIETKKTLILKIQWCVLVECYKTELHYLDCNT